MGKIMSPTDRDDEHEKSRTATLKQWVETQASVLTWERCKMQRFSSQAFLATWVQGKTCQNILNHWGIYISGNMLGICCPAKVLLISKLSWLLTFLLQVLQTWSMMVEKGGGQSKAIPPTLILSRPCLSRLLQPALLTYLHQRHMRQPAFLRHCNRYTDKTSSFWSLFSR